MTLICGIDEAGRGPIIGPMVMAGVLVDEEGSDSLRSIGVKDSKLLTIGRMRKLFDKIKKIAVRHKIVIIQPSEIDAALNSDSLNLNWLEAHKSADIINTLKPKKTIIDSPSNNVVDYKRYLVKLLDNETYVITVRVVKSMEALAHYEPKVMDEHTFEVELNNTESLNDLILRVAEVGMTVTDIRPKGNRLEKLFLNILKEK